MSIFVTYLPRDLVVDILLRLPVKFLIQCKLVSKPWCKLIGDPVLAEEHLKRNRNIYKLILKSSYPREHTVIHKNTHFPLDIQICSDSVLGSCNGLMCICRGEFIMILNPTTREIKVLPKGWQRWQSSNPGRNVDFGFGYDMNSKDYKVVNVTRWFFRGNGRPSSASQVSVYSLKNNSWKTIKDTPYAVVGSGKFVGSALHWMARSCISTQSTYNLIISFNVEQERFQEVPQGNYQYDKLLKVELAELDGHLCLVCFYKECVKVWMMKDYGLKESWTVLLSIKATTGFNHHSQLVPLRITEEGQVLVLTAKRFNLIPTSSCDYMPNPMDIPLQLYGLDGGSSTKYMIPEAIQHFSQVTRCRESLFVLEKQKH